MGTHAAIKIGLLNVRSPTATNNQDDAGNCCAHPFSQDVSADALTMRRCFGLQTGIRRSASPVSPTLAPSWRARACLKIIVRPQPILDYGALLETVLE